MPILQKASKVKHIKNVLPTIALFCLLPLLLTNSGFAQSTPKTPPNKQDKAKASKVKPPVAAKKTAQQSSKKTKPAASGETKTPDKKKPAVVLSEKRRAELLAFCEQHHQELLPLLKSLQKNRPAEFEKALRTLDREIKQLQVVKSKERYEKLLAQWVLRSKIKLLSARLAVRTSKEQRAKTTAGLSKLIGQLQDLKIKHLNEEQQALRSRTAKIGTQIEQLRSTRDAEIKKQIDAFTKNAERIKAAQKARVAGKNKSKNAGKPPATTQEATKKNQAKKTEKNKG